MARTFHIRLSSVVIYSTQYSVSRPRFSVQQNLLCSQNACMFHKVLCTGVIYSTQYTAYPNNSTSCTVFTKCVFYESQNIVFNIHISLTIHCLSRGWLSLQTKYTVFTNFFYESQNIVFMSHVFISANNQVT